MCLCGSIQKWKACHSRDLIPYLGWDGAQDECGCGCGCYDPIGPVWPASPYCLRCRQGHHMRCAGCGRVGSPAFRMTEWHTQNRNPGAQAYGEIKVDPRCDEDEGCLNTPVGNYKRGGVPPIETP